VSRIGHRIVSSLGAMLGIQAAKATVTSSHRQMSHGTEDLSRHSKLLMPHDTPVMAVARQMARLQSTAIVLHEPGALTQITGIVTARDIVTKIIASPSPAEGYASPDGLEREPCFLRAMTFDPVMVLEETANVQLILDEMQRRRFR
jgi:CBS domain containing-hemolysin-like protein